MTLTPQSIASGQQNAQIGTDLVLETDTMRVWHLRLAPGETIPPHRHDRPYFWTVLTDGKGVSRFDDGQVVPITYKIGDTKNFADLTPSTGFVHDLSNTGDSDLIFVTVEFNTEGKTS
ncbi:cupin domain-containing protein [uncultured Roseovarius sp.]|uniref:cupin domain-containing protein n=1 Tax=uncultured Roseovarius sp. TaxID=293344 RepID=UPI002639B20E|nr:cupin domain-containing protein [uncultured Roseovarius sp.]